MIHQHCTLDPLDNHYGVSLSGCGEVLAQTQQRGDQARIRLTPSEARHFARLLVEAAEEAERRVEVRRASSGRPG